MFAFFFSLAGVVVNVSNLHLLWFAACVCHLMLIPFIARVE